MTNDNRRPHDIAILDAIDASPREPVTAPVWRVVRSGRDPLLGSTSRSRWCNAKFDVLYTSFERDGAIAEIYSLLSLQPVFPSNIRWEIHQIRVSTRQTLRLADLASLGRLGVDVARFRERAYERTQEIADAAFFLGFDGLIAPSARWACLNLILFTDRVQSDQLETTDAVVETIDWEAWRKHARVTS